MQRAGRLARPSRQADGWREVSRGTIALAPDGLSAAIASGPAMTGQRNLAEAIHNSPRQAAQRQLVETLQGASQAMPRPHRSGVEVLMPGLDGGGGGAGGGDRRKRAKKEDKDDEKERGPPPPRRATRGAAAIYDANRPTLTYAGNYQGVANQQLASRQEISFNQNATLTRPHGAPQGAAFYYGFRQEVCDGYASRPAEDHDHDVGDFEQDGPFQPDYDDENITDTGASIDFHDNPGFSGDTAIPEDHWLNWYEVRFRWTVTRADRDSGTWISPVVTHRMDAAYTDGSNVPVVTASTPGATWDVNIPDA